MAKIKINTSGTEGLPDDTVLWDDIDSDIDDEWRQFMLDLFPELADYGNVEEESS